MFRTIIAPGATVEDLRAACSALGESCCNMFTCELVGANGSFFMSSGVIAPELESLLETATAQYGLDVSSENPLVAMERLQLEFIP